MKCVIVCSIGEVIDKITILQIKNKKASNKEVKQNIQRELNLLEESLPETIKPSKNQQDSEPKSESKPESECDINVFLEELYKVNSKLWILEDLIREKSRNKSFDDKYIEYAESIHETNDERYRIKRSINEKYNSEIKEEKIYSTESTPTLNPKTTSPESMNQLNRAMSLYTRGLFDESLLVFDKLIRKYVEKKEMRKLDDDIFLYNKFYILLFFSYKLICEISGKSNPYQYHLDIIMKGIRKGTILVDEELKTYCINQYGLFLLKNKRYEDAYPYVYSIGCITGPGVNNRNMSFLSSTDNNKTQLIYDGGGIGDKVMFSRFIPTLCELNRKANHYNHIVFFTEDNLLWMFRYVFKHITNLSIVGYKNANNLPSFQHHCSMMELLKHLKVTYDNLVEYPQPVLKELYTQSPTSTAKKQLRRLREIPNLNMKKTYVFNWKGNATNKDEKFNRGMELRHAIPLFKLKSKGFSWVVITKEVTKEEKNLLKKYGVHYLGDKLDKNGKCYEDSIHILREVAGVVTTDTSLAHLSGSLGLSTSVFLTIGNEWRWSSSSSSCSQITSTNWYPSPQFQVTLFKQKRRGDWSGVVKDYIHFIYDNTTSK